MSSTASIQSGRLDLPKPGCDGAISRCRADSGRDIGMLGRKTASAVQEQEGRAIAGLEQLKLDAGDRDDFALQGTSS